jgi:hypothetical protein
LRSRRPGAKHAPGRSFTSERITAAERLWDSTLVEKIALISMVFVIFGQILPNSDLSALQLAVGISVIVVANTFVSHVLVRRGVSWATLASEFGAMLVINLGLALLGEALLPGGRELHRSALLFFLFLLTLMVTMYDRYRPRYLARFEVNPSF